MPKKGCLGCSFPLLIGISVVVIVLVVIGLISGALGNAIMGESSLGEMFAIEKPHIQLPAENIIHVYQIPGLPAWIGEFNITNTLITSWLSIIVLVLLAYAVTHRIKLIPSRLQTLVEFAIEYMLNFCIDVAGEKNGRRFFPIITTIFLFVLMNAWMNLIPGYGSVTLGEEILSGSSANPGEVSGHVIIVTDIEDISEVEEHSILVAESILPEYISSLEHFSAVIIEEKSVSAEAQEKIEELDIPCIINAKDATNVLEDHQKITVDASEGTISEKVHLLRGANTDINLPLAIAIISLIFVEYHGLKALGTPYLKTFFNFGRFFKGHGILFRGKIKSGLGEIFMGFIDAFVGILEFISHLSRVISFTFRLFGNMTGGEILILMMIFLIPWILAIPFYGLELLVGLIQAIVFAGLTLVFAAVAVIPHGGEEH